MSTGLLRKTNIPRRTSRKIISKTEKKEQIPSAALPDAEAATDTICIGLGMISKPVTQLFRHGAMGSFLIFIDQQSAR